MQLLTNAELEEAAQSEEGLCLECGYRQPFQERYSMRFGLCEDCGMQRVLRAADLHDGLELLEREE